MSTIAQGPTSAGPSPGLLALFWLTRREFIRFGRQPSRVIAAIGTPLLLWVFFGAGFAGSFAPANGGSYAGYLLPGMASLTVMFSSIFAAMSLIEDRRAGFLQSVLASPAPRWAVTGAKIAGGSLLATLQGAVLLLLAPLMGVSLSALGFLEAAAALLVMSVAINGLGLAAAWRIDSTQGFHGVMNLVLMPMWLLSGALFPWGGAAVWLKTLMLINPLFWPTAALRHAMMPELSTVPLSVEALRVMAVLVGTAGFLVAWVSVGRVRSSRLVRGRP